MASFCKSQSTNLVWRVRAWLGQNNLELGEGERGNLLWGDVRGETVCVLSFVHLDDIKSLVDGLNLVLVLLSDRGRSIWSITGVECVNLAEVAACATATLYLIGGLER